MGVEAKLDDFRQKTQSLIDRQLESLSENKNVGQKQEEGIEPIEIKGLDDNKYVDQTTTEFVRQFVDQTQDRTKSLADDCWRLLEGSLLLMT